MEKENNISCLVIGDPHFKSNNIPECTKMVEKIIEQIQRTNPDFVVCLGDILHKHEKIDMDPLHLANTFIKDVAKIKPIYVLIGNHDRPNNSDFLSDKHPFTGVKGQANIHIVDKAQRYNIGGLDFVMIPYVYPGLFIKAIETLSDSSDKDDGGNFDEIMRGVTAVFGHQEFRGAKMGAVTSKVGDTWPGSAPLCISGHIHEYDRLQDNLIYVGTPMQHNFGEREDKTVSLFRFPLSKCTDSRDNNSSFQEERIDLGMMKRKIVRLEASKFDEKWTKPENTLCKLILLGNNAEIKTVMKHPHIKTIHKEGVCIAYKENAKMATTSPSQRPKKQLDYLQSLYKKIQDNKGMVNIYEQVFGKCTVLN